MDAIPKIKGRRSGSDCIKSWTALSFGGDENGLEFVCVNGGAYVLENSIAG